MSTIFSIQNLSVSCKKIRFSNIIRILISAAVMIFDYKIKMKTDKTFIKTFIEILSKIFDKNHVTFNDYSDEIKINQNSVFSSANMIITKKIIFILNAIFQIIQLEIVNSLLISIKYL